MLFNFHLLLHNSIDLFIKKVTLYCSVKNSKSKLRTFLMSLKNVLCVSKKDKALQILHEYAV